MTQEWKGLVGDRLLRLRNEKGMTQEDLAEYLNVSRQSVSKWELNKTLPDVEKLMQLSELYEVTLDYLVKGAEEVIEEKSEASDDEEIRVKVEKEEQDACDSKDGEKSLLTQSAFELMVHRIIFLVAMLVSGFVFVCSAFFSVRLLGSHTFNMDGKEQDVAYVDQVYEQYTLADVQIMDENENLVTKRMWIDVNGVREGDYIGYYYDEDEISNIHFVYYTKSLVVPFIVMILSLMFTIICWLGFRSHRTKIENN